MSLSRLGKPKFCFFIIVVFQPNETSHQVTKTQLIIFLNLGKTLNLSQFD